MSFRKPGFTLIEMLTTAAIGAMVIVVLLPVIQHSRDTAKGVQCGANLRQLEALFWQYAETYKGYMMAVNLPTDPTVKGGAYATTEWPWHMHLWATPDVSYPNPVPGASVQKGFNFWDPIGTKASLDPDPRFLCPTMLEQDLTYLNSKNDTELPDTPRRLTTYSQQVITDDVNLAGLAAFQTINNVKYPNHPDTAEFTRPGDTLHLFDGRVQNAMYPVTYWSIRGTFHTVQWNNPHNGWNNGVFLDGHVKTFHHEDIQGINLRAVN